MRSRVFASFALLPLLLIVACRDVPSPASNETETAVEVVTTSPQSTIETSTSEATVTPTPTTIPPSPTPAEPLAALVNDQPIFLSAYEKELARYERAQAELGTTVGSEAGSNYQELVLDALIEQVLIAQAAEAQGLEVTPAMIDEKMAELRSAAGDSDNFDAWLEANQWTEDEFREALAAEMLTEQVVAKVTADVPYAVEQVRARYLQVADLALAQSLVEQLETGTDFTSLAEQHSLDRLTAQNGGDLGFFARGSLLVPSVEASAFALEPGEVSDVITETSEDGSQTTYYLVQLIERDPQRPLTADLRYKLLQQTFESWLDSQWEQATIVRFVNTDT